MADDDAVVLRARLGAELLAAGLTWSLVPLTVLLLTAIRGDAGVLPWVVLPLWVVVTAVTLVRTARRTLRQPWRVRVDRDGLTYHRDAVESAAVWRTGGPVHLPWASLVALRRTEPPPTWAWVPGLSDTVRLVDSGQLDFARRAGVRPGEHVLRTRYLDASADQLVAAMARFAPPTVWGRLGPEAGGAPGSPDPTRTTG